MEIKTLNQKLIFTIPELKEKYLEEISWQDGENTGSHVIFCDVFVPFIKENVERKNDALIKKCFDFIENLLDLEDKYTDEVITFSVIETLLFDEDVENKSFLKFCGAKTLTVVEEIVKYIAE